MTVEHDFDDPGHKGQHVHAHVHSDGYIHTHEHLHGLPHDHHTDSPAPALLNVDGVNFEYKTARVLNEICVGVARGEILAILGPNGVGKSTLLKCMNLILRPKTGTVMLGELDLTKMNGNDIAKNVGYVAQRNDSARMTVFDSILLGRKPHIGWHVTDRDYSIVENAIERFGLSDMQLRYIDELSGGNFSGYVFAVRSFRNLQYFYWMNRQVHWICAGRWIFCGPFEMLSTSMMWRRS